MPRRSAQQQEQQVLLASSPPPRRRALRSGRQVGDNRDEEALSPPPPPAKMRRTLQIPKVEAPVVASKLMVPSSPAPRKRIFRSGRQEAADSREEEEPMSPPPPLAKARRIVQTRKPEAASIHKDMGHCAPTGISSLLMKSRQEHLSLSVANPSCARPNRRICRKQPAAAVEEVAIVPSLSLLERADVAFRPGEHKGKMPCREEEWKDLSGYLRSALLQGGTSQVLYVSGMPGTGKTALALQVIKQLSSDRSLGQKFLAVHVNAMRLGCPQAVFAAITQQLGLRQPGAAVSAGVARTELTNFFSQRHEMAPPIVLLVDEVDHLVTPNQSVLYHLFDWLGLPHPGLIIVAISNTMDLPERLLPRVASRFGIVRIDFQPYRKPELITILQERLRARNAEDAISDTALRLVAARVAAGSGDLRKALQLCRQAVEVCSLRTGGTGPVSMADLEVAEKDILHANPVAQAVSGLGVRARRFLTAVVVELRKREGDGVPLRKVTNRYSRLCSGSEGAPIAASAHDTLFRAEEANHLLRRMEALSVLVMRHGATKEDAAGIACPIVVLGAGLDVDDLSRALLRVEQDEGMKSILANEQLLPIACEHGDNAP